MSIFFNVHTAFKSNTEYIFDGTNTHIYPEDTTRAEGEKYFCFDGNRQGVGYLPTAFYLCGLKNLTLDFGGAVLTLHGRIQPFILDRCENVTIKNVTIGYSRPFYTEMQVLENTGTELVTTIDSIFTCRVENGYFIPYGENWEDTTLHIRRPMFLQGFDTETCLGKGAMVIYLGETVQPHPTAPVSNIPQVKVRCADGRYVFAGRFPENWQEGTTVVLEHEPREKTNCAIYHCKNITIENYRILNGCGIGFLAIYTENIAFCGVKLFRDELSKTLVTNPADSIHLVSCKGKVTVTDCVIEGMIDDGLNIHGNYWHVVSGEGNVLHIRRCSDTDGLGSDAETFDVGDVISVYKGRTLEEKSRFIVTGWKKTGTWTMDLTVDGDTSMAENEDIVENRSANADLEIRNCRFANANSHIRLQTRGDVLIENCDFGIPVWLSGDMNYWFESSPVEHAVIRNCRFYTQKARIRICPEFTPTEKAPFYHGDLYIADTTFERVTALNGTGIRSVTMENCRTCGGEDFDLSGLQCEKLEMFE